MLGYVLKAVNLKNNKEYVSKVYAVKFDKSFLGDNHDLIEDVEKTGISNFDIKMIVPCETTEDVDTMYAKYAVVAKPKRTRKKAEKVDE